jgi:CelD/BcsL family acetyltransferase involved in cellulose biosynthesis
MRIYRIDPLRDPRWERFTETHPLATIFHSLPWLQALHRTYGYEASALTLSPPEDAITNALVFCRVSSWLTGSRLVSLPFSDHCDVLASDPLERNQLLQAIIHHTTEIGAKYVEIRPACSEVEGQTQFRESKACFLHKLDLRPSPEKLVRSFHRDSIQRKIRRAEREGLRLEEGRDHRMLGTFRRLLLATRRRHGFPPPPEKWFRNLIDSMGDRLTIRVAYKGESPVAGLLTLRSRATMVYKYGGSDARYHALGGMQALMWRTIQAARETGLQHFDFGRSDIEQQGLITFKDRWGTDRMKLSYFRYASKPAHGSAATSWTTRAMRPLIDVIPDGVLSAAGELLYRHVG